MNKRAKSGTKPANQAQHPEVRHSTPKGGVPGSERSKAKSGATDVRHAHDQDGNTQQRAR